MNLPQAVGWYTTIDEIANTSSYNGFINYFSYDVELENFLAGKKSIYGNSPLTKLSIYRTKQSDYPQLPQAKKYYINAGRIMYWGNPLAEHVYTQKTGDGLYTEISPYPINDVIVNNYFHYPIYREFTSISIPYI
jgi:hypothetical protein